MLFMSEDINILVFMCLKGGPWHKRHPLSTSEKILLAMDLAICSRGS